VCKFVGNIKMEPKNGSENMDWTDSEQFPDATIKKKESSCYRNYTKHVSDDKLL
jgi:hypothetical protein